MRPDAGERGSRDQEGRNMAINSLKRWEREFKKAARADNLELFRNHLAKLGLPDKPELLLQGTISVVVACCVYYQMDGRSCDGFLDMQKYDPSDAEDARYMFTFDLFGKAFGRILVSGKPTDYDLADLYGHGYSEYKLCGYSCLWISRTDGKDLLAEEIEKFEEDVTEDLRYDYDEDELGFWFDDSLYKGVLYVYLYDVFDLEDEDG